MFPTSTFTLYLIEHHVPVATVTLPAVDAAPECTLPVILPLYHAHAYPAAYYAPGARLKILNLNLNSL